MRLIVGALLAGALLVTGCGTELMWQVDAPATAGNLLSPTVRYDRAPDEGSEQAPAEPVTAGQLYVLVLSEFRP